ncbi:MAG: hypothetical protein DDT31_01299 [Syntrophomonadaceae bacterium]|nr:hypothetical protein [Bacillota bacterium]
MFVLIMVLLSRADFIENMTGVVLPNELSIMVGSFSFILSSIVLISVYCDYRIVLIRLYRHYRDKIFIKR